MTKELHMKLYLGRFIGKKMQGFAWMDQEE